MSSDICGQRRSRSDCASAQSDQGLRCPLTESFDSINVSVESKCLNETVHAQDESETCASCACFSHALAHMVSIYRQGRLIVIRLCVRICQKVRFLMLRLINVGYQKPILLRTENVMIIPRDSKEL